jgi:LEA14-like dessication related protein
MKLSATAKTVIGIVALAGAYRLYKLYEAGNQITYVPVDVRFLRSGGSFQVVVTLQMNNPTRTTINLRGLRGILNIGGNNVSTFSSGPGRIPPGDSKIHLTFDIDNLNLITQLVTLITTKKWPTLNVRLNTLLPLFSVSEDFSIDTAQYAGKAKGLIFKES